ncbi:TetR/AcrR family transcriptional regulator [Staphylococcus saprophyticus]|uniref:TetR/AcrR family transcriptional regulator n=2 Tax=Staphylococcus saprophyticus TaxID=29385 RepID=UPI002DB6FB98|nr:TetR family transcriptional regulator [Staphylococcus saprophyticus]
MIQCMKSNNLYDFVLYLKNRSDDVGYQRKTTLTQKRIKNSLVTLLETHKFDLITVNQIVEEAEITRSTFYRYYDDKYNFAIRDRRDFDAFIRRTSKDRSTICERRYVEC